MHLRISIIALAFAATAIPAFAQSTTSAGATASANAPRERPQSAPQEGSANDDQMGTSAAYQHTGGSLMRANRGVSAPGDPGASTIDPRIAAASFFAVPPPVKRVIQPKDLITIIIKEQAEYKSDGTSKLDKSASLQATLRQFIKLNLSNASVGNAIGTGGITPSVDMDGSEKFDGKGSAERKDSLSVRMQAMVVDVKPNGNLVLAARRRIKTDDEERVYLVSGTARVEDVTTDNSILSTQLADFDLVQDSKGTVASATRRGWLPKLLDALNPF